MQASFVELRTKANEILQAIERNETVTLLYRGRPKAVIKPIVDRETPPMKAEDHPAFGMWKDRDDLENVDAAVRAMRRGRFDAI